MNDTSKASHWFIHTALSYLGTPYVWGGDDPSGFDCSGFVLECLKTVGLVKEEEDFTADSLFQKLLPFAVDKPQQSALLFSLDQSGHAFHVVICLDEHFQIGASGGGSKTTDSISAWRDNAYIKIRPIREERGDSVRFLFPFGRINS